MKKYFVSILSCFFAAGIALGDDIFEAEELVVGSVLKKSRTVDRNWCVWTGDSDALKKWTRGSTVAAQGVRKTIPPSQARKLKIRIPVKQSGTYFVQAKLGGRPMACSVDNGRSWNKVLLGKPLMKPKKLRAGDNIDIILANCYEYADHGPVYVDTVTLRSLKEDLDNGNFSTAAENDDVIPGWEFYAREPELNKAEYCPGEKKINIRAKGRMDWSLKNKAMLPSFDGGCWSFSGKVKNIGKRKARLIINAYAGVAFRRLYDIQPGESIDWTLDAVARENQNFMTFTLSGYQSGEFEISNCKAVFKGNVKTKNNPGFFKSVSDCRVIRQKAGGAKIVPDKTGKKWCAELSEIFSNYPGKHVRFAFEAFSVDGGKLVADVPAFLGEIPACRSLETCEWIFKAGERKKITMDVAMIQDLNGAKLRLSGEGTFYISEVKAQEGNPKFLKSTPAKIAMPAFPKQVEKFSRGVFAAQLAKNKAYISWRLLPGEPADAAFDVFGITKSGEVEKLNPSPILRTTDFVVKNGSKFIKYRVVPKSSDLLVGECGVLPYRTGQFPYKEYKLSAPPRNIGIGDLDGDGEYDFVVRTGKEGIDPWHVVWHPSKTTFKLEALHKSGRKLWEFDCSYNIECGVWYAPFAVYDLNGDGRAEVILKGTLPEDGDCREYEGLFFGRVISGPERILVLDGMTGKIIAHAPWPGRREFLGPDSRSWEYASRNQMAIAYLDGKTPAVIALRGTYTLMLADAWSFKNNKLEKLWTYSSYGQERKFHGQGAHATRCADIDGDGRDEILLGGAVLDDDGTALWSTGRGHPDYIFVGDLSDKNNGIESYTIYESRNKSGGHTMADAKSGKILWELKESSTHIHRGYAGDIDARYPGVENGGADSITGGHYGKLKHRHYTADGELLAEDEKAPMYNYRGFVPHFIFWDADLQREYAGTSITDFRGGPSSLLKTGGSFFMQADLDGDWREEMITRLPYGFRVYHTTIPAFDRRETLMSDMCYRLALAASSSGYFHDPMPSVLFEKNSPNLNITDLKDEKNTVEAIVVAPKDRAISGVLTFKVRKDMKLSINKINISLKAGERMIRKVTYKTEKKNYFDVEAELKLKSGELLRVTVPVKKR